MTKEQISIEEKQQIVDDLLDYIEARAGGSRNKASKKLKDVSGAYISHMINGVEKPMLWKKIADSAWYNVQKQVCNPNDDWVVVNDLTNMEDMADFYEDARTHANTFGIVGFAGVSKSQSAKEEARNNETTFMVGCRHYHSPKTFLINLLNEMGVEVPAAQIDTLMTMVISNLRKLKNPLIILDEADKLKDHALYNFICLYNDLEDQCGLIMMGSPHLQRMIMAGKKREKKGYREILSRLGGKFIVAEPPTDEDQEKIIRANGVTDPLVVQYIINNSGQDLRRVKRLVHAYKRGELDV